LINPPNFLLLDEPTTHLDVDAVDALIKALKNYEGTIVFISHDIHFVRSVANVAYEVKSGRVRKFPGNFDYYLDKKQSADGYIVEPVSTRAISDKIQKPKEKTSPALQKEEGVNPKFHNFNIKEKIKKLKSEKDNLNLEASSKKRAIENPRSYRDNESLEEYIERLQEIEKRITEINDQIRALKKQIID